jgi:hypothetical protein
VSVPKPETAFDITSLFAQLNDSFTQAAVKLNDAFRTDPRLQALPFVYHMPRMHLSMRLVLSHTDGKVTGVFHKDKSEQTQELTSVVEVEVVAVPRTGAGANPTQA